MASDPKLLAVRKTYEVRESEVLEEHRRIEAIVDVRQRAVDEVAAEVAALTNQIGELRSKKRKDAFARGDSALLASIDEYERHLSREREKITRVLEERSKESESAKQRLEQSHAEVVAVRIELKKIDTLLEGRAHRSRVVEVAREEVLTDEMAFYRKPKS